MMAYDVFESHPSTMARILKYSAKRRRSASYVHVTVAQAQSRESIALQPLKILTADLPPFRTDILTCCQTAAGLLR